MNLLTQVATAIPGIKYLLDLRRRFQFRYCRGVFPTFQAARANIPARLPVGYADHPDNTKIHLHLLGVVQPSDYAIMYWLGPLLAEHRYVFDFGGNLGVSYYAFEKYLHFPPELRWVICDVPAVVAAGRELALERKAAHLEFTAEFSGVDGFDVLFTSGTLQLIEQDLSTLLSALKKRPRHLLINRVPLSDRPTYFTVVDKRICSPYRIANRTEFIGSLERLGYELIDSWNCCESSCRILFHPGRKVSPYSGMYLRQR